MPWSKWIKTFSSIYNNPKDRQLNTWNLWENITSSIPSWKYSSTFFGVAIYIYIYIYTHCHYSLKQPWASLPSSSALLCWKSTHSRCFSKGPTQKVDKEMQAWHNFQRCVCSHSFLPPVLWACKVHVLFSQSLPSKLRTGVDLSTLTGEERSRVPKALWQDLNEAAQKLLRSFNWRRE